MVKGVKPEGLLKLDAFVGSWRTTGRVLTAQASGMEIKGLDTYEWLPGGHFLFHRVDVMMGIEREQSIEIIGFDVAREIYPMHYYDSHGASGTMEATIKNGTWTFLSENIRFLGSFNEGGNILTGSWEQATANASWIPWMEIKLEKQ